jgi:hypothetical protein
MIVVLLNCYIALLAPFVWLGLVPLSRFWKRRNHVRDAERQRGASGRRHWGAGRAVICR